MDYFGHVHFGPNEKEAQRKFLEIMNSAAIIQISDDDLDQMYAEDMQSPYGSDNHLVLHGEEQKKRFGYVMGAFFPNKDYDITEEPGSKEFQDWLDRKRTKNTPLDEKGGGLK